MTKYRLITPAFRYTLTTSITLKTHQDRTRACL
jgi:hypothetical protein